MFKFKRIKLLVLTLLLAALCATAATVLLACSHSREAVEQTATKEDGDEQERYFRVLVAGEDRASGLSDVLMLICLDRQTDEAWVMQLPRDTYAAYTDRSYKKLNGAPQTLGSMEELCSFLSESMGIGIDHYVRLSLDVLRDAVDAVGGVEIELDRTMYYNDPEQGLAIHLPKGKQTLNGEQAEQLVRYRWGYARGDLDRLDVQKQFLAAFARRVRESLSPMVAIRLASSLLGRVETNLSLTDLPMLVREAMALEDESIFFVTAPGSEATAKSGASYYALCAASMDRLLSEHFGAETGGFDPRHVFLNPNNEGFIKIYEDELPYRVSSVADCQ